METTTLAPVSIRFEELRRLNAGRVSDRFPILCFEDRAESEDLVRGYLHLDFMSVFFARQGSGIHLVDEVPFEVQAGDVYAMGYGMSHRFEGSRGLTLDSVHFVPTMFSSETREALAATEGLAPMFLGCEGAGSSRWLRLNKAAHLQATETLREMRQEWLADAPDRALMVQGTFLRFLIFLARCHREVHRSGARVALTARASIDLRYAEPLRVADLAASAFLSVGRFSGLFREEVGCSPREYLGGVRIRAARRLLLETDLTVAAVGARTGFPDPAYFARFFHQQLGLSPSEFRKSGGFDPSSIQEPSAEE